MSGDNVLFDVEALKNVSITEEDIFTFIDNQKPLQTAYWEIHVSLSKEAYLHQLDSIIYYLNERGLRFKFVNSLKSLKIMLSDAVQPSQIGKLITIYPENEVIFLNTMSDLY